LINKLLGSARNLTAGSIFPQLSCTYRKKGFIMSGRPRSGAFVSALLIPLKAFSYSSSKIMSSYSPPFMASYRGFADRVIGDPDSAEICSPTGA
jgi:hypothetical protein